MSGMCVRVRVRYWVRCKGLVLGLGVGVRCQG